jgi:glycosyltransferase involved in cell wall biosynthesis
MMLIFSKFYFETVHLSSLIFFLGSVDRQTLTGLFQSCDVFCLPSVECTEAFGLVLLYFNDKAY